MALVGSKSTCRSVRIVSGSGEVVGAFGRREGVDGGADGARQVVDGAGGCFSQGGLELGEGVFDRVEVR